MVSFRFVTDQYKSAQLNSACHCLSQVLNSPYSADFVASYYSFQHLPTPTFLQASNVVGRHLLLLLYTARQHLHDLSKVPVHTTVVEVSVSN